MADGARWTQILEDALSVGSHDGEPEAQRGGGRVLLVAIYVATALSIPAALVDLDAGYIWVAVLSLVTIAVVPGTHTFSCDLWGDTVNSASRMESAGVPGSIQVGPATYGLIRSEYACEPRGIVPMKGNGEMDTYFLISSRDAPLEGRS
jgi:hypothetical protein